MKETLQSLPGVTNVDVDFEARTANVSVEDPEKFDDEAAVKALAEKGFEESTVERPAT